VFVALPLRGRDAASLLGTTTETISRVLAAWKRSGRVRASRDGVWIRAREPGRRYAGTR
jgi:CRP-like cAMP-binding protein